MRRGVSSSGRCLACLALNILVWTTLSASAQRLPIKLYTTADGLAHDAVYKIVRDSRGFLWFCTFEGLSRFDGYTFTTYGVAEGLPSQVVKDLLETRDGQYWVATDAGLCRFNPNGIPRRASITPGGSGAAPAMFVVYSPGKDRGSHVVTSLLQDRSGTIWCGTFGGLYRLEERSGLTGFRHISTQLGVTSLLEDRRGSLWLGLVRGIARLLPDGRLERYSARQGFPNDAVLSLLEDRDGWLWAGTRQRGLWRLISDPDRTPSVAARVYSNKEGLPATEIKGLFQASDGALWAGSNHGLIKFVHTSDGGDFSFRIQAEPQGLSSFPVHSVAEDRNGNLWLGTGAGAARLARSGITSFTDAEGFTETAAIFNDRNGDVVVVGGALSRNFISRFVGERLTTVQAFPQAPRFGRLWRDNRGLLQDRAGEWWMASGHGLYRFLNAGSLEQVTRTPPKAVYTTRDGLASNDIWGLFEDSRGDIWIATAGGLSRWERASDAVHRFDKRDGWLWPESPVSFGEDRAGAVWIGMSIGGGLVRYRDGRFGRFTTADGLAEGGTLNLFLDSSGRLWVPMSPGGVFRIDNPEAERPTIVPYTTAQGLAGNDAEAVTEDRRGRIYLVSARGIDRLDPATGHVRHYTPNEGALRSGVGSALQARDGSLWFRYGTGLVRLVPEPESPATPTSVLITGLRISGETQPISALGETNVAATVLPADRNQIQIDFVALGLNPGEGSRYQYRLEGTAKDWTAIGEQRTVNFAHLAPGRYRFLVRALSAEGALSSVPASFAFIILPPFWQRWWFLSAASIIVLLAGYTVHRARLARLLDLERVRTRIAADLHDDIGSSLSQISVLSEVLRTQLGAQPGASISGNISLINRVSQEALDSMSDIVWAINPRQDHLSDLVRRMRRVASEMLAARGIDFMFITAPAGPDLSLGADTRRQLFLMFKEAINNVVRHSKCERATLELKLESPWLALVIADNGKGFDPDDACEGNGLASLRRRARALGGEIEVSSRRGEGTAISIRIPLRHHWRFVRLASAGS